MSTETIVAELPKCVRCGAKYRPSSFQRASLCPVCGHSLDGPGPRVRQRISPVLAFGVVAVCLGAGVAALAAKSFTNRRVATSQAARGERTLSLSELPAGFRALVDDKIRFLRGDLERNPGDPVLLSALGDAYTYRALVARDTPGSGAEMQESLAQVSTCIRRLETSEPLAAQQLQRRLDVFDQLVFVDRSPGSAVAQAWRLRSGREIFPGESGARASSSDGSGVMVGAGRPLGTAAAGSTPIAGGAVPGPGAASGALPGGANLPAPNPAAGTGAARRASIDPPLTPRPIPGSAAGQVATASEVASRMLPQNAAAPFSGDSVREEPPNVGVPTVELNRLRRLFRENPQDPTLADEVGRALLSRGSQYVATRVQDEAQQAGKRNLQEAARVFRSAAKTARVAVEKAAFFEAAAEVHRQLEEWDAQYRMLLAATRNAPFASVLWRKLEKAALRQGEMEVYQTAHQNAARWTFPAIDVTTARRPASVDK